MTTRLHLLCVAATAGVRSVAFAAADEPLDAHGLGSLGRLRHRALSYDSVLRSPAMAAAQTAAGLALNARPEPALRDCDAGRWTGRSLVDIQAQEPEAVADWLRNPCSAPHGGESVADVLTRVGAWMERLGDAGGSVLAITHAAVMRAAIAHALRAGPETFSHIDIAPLTRLRLSCFGGRWTLSALVPGRDER